MKTFLLADEKKLMVLKIADIFFHLSYVQINSLKRSSVAIMTDSIIRVNI